MSAVLSSVWGAGAQLFTTSGVILAGGKIATYLAGTTTPQATWTDSTQLVQNANPIILDSAGRPPNEIWLQNNTSYKFVLSDSNNNVLTTVDNIPGVNSNTSSFSEWVAGSTPAYISSTSFSMAGNQTAIYASGRRVQYSVNSGTFYGTVTASVYNGTTLTTVTISPDSTALDASLSGINYGFLNASPSSVPVTSGTFVTSQQLQNQSFIGFPTSGTNAAYTLSPSPATVSNIVGQEFDAVFHTPNLANATIAISGRAALNLVKYTSTGGTTPLIAADVATGFRSKIVVMDASNALVRTVINPQFGLVTPSKISVLGGGSIATNQAYGLQALQSNTTGTNNNALGLNALGSNTIGSNNTAIGLSALASNTSGTSSTAIGLTALQFNTSGNNNTAIGQQALINCSTGSGNIGIGPLTDAGVASPVFAVSVENNRIVMGSTAATNAYVQVAWTVVSDARDKMNFASVPHGLDFINKLKPTSYQFRVSRENGTAHGPVRYGFKAQDILEVEGDAPVVVDAENPQKLLFNESCLIPILVNAINELSGKVAALELKICKG